MAYKLVNTLLFIALIALVSILGYRFFLSSSKTTATTITTVESADGFEQIENEKIQEIVKEYILNNPEIIISSIEQLQKRKMQEMEASNNTYINKSKIEIENKSLFPVLGNKNGDITIVSFYDYACGYCKKGDQIINKLITHDNKIAVILRPFPILGDNSLYAAKIMLAVHRIYPEKFTSLHEKIFLLEKLTSQNIQETLASEAIDMNLIEKEVNNPDLENLFAKTFDIASNLKIHGVPAYIINGKLVAGMIDFEKLNGLIAEIREETK